MEAAFRLNPREYLSALTLGQIYAYTKDFAQAISLRPQSSPPYIDKAVQYLSADGSNARAVRTLREAKVAAGPNILVSVDSDRVPRLMTLIQAAPGDFLEALEETAHDTTAVDRSVYYLARGEYLRRTGSPGVAQTYFDSARVVLEPLDEAAAAEGSEEWAANLAIAYSGLGRGADAVQGASGGVPPTPQRGRS